MGSSRYNNDSALTQLWAYAIWMLWQRHLKACHGQNQMKLSLWCHKHSIYMPQMKLHSSASTITSLICIKVVIIIILNWVALACQKLSDEMASKNMDTTLPSFHPSTQAGWNVSLTTGIGKYDLHVHQALPKTTKSSNCWWLERFQAVTPWC